MYKIVIDKYVVIKCSLLCIKYYINVNNLTKM